VQNNCLVQQNVIQEQTIIFPNSAEAIRLEINNHCDYDNFNASWPTGDEWRVSERDQMWVTDEEKCVDKRQSK